MKRVFIFPTIEEAKGFILTEPRDAVFIGGVGAAEIAAATVRAVKAKKPHLVVLCGIAGAYTQELRRGEVVEVVTERIAGIPERYARDYDATGPDTGLPLAAGVSVNRSAEGLPQAQKSGDTPVTGPEAGASQTTGPEAGQSEGDVPAGEDFQQPLPLVENMEGAAFFAVCEAMGVASCQIRAVSNYVGEPFEQWAVEDAVANLTDTLTHIFKSDEQQQ